MRGLLLIAAASASHGPARADRRAHDETTKKATARGLSGCVQAERRRLLERGPLPAQHRHHRLRPAGVHVAGHLPGQGSTAPKSPRAASCFGVPRRRYSSARAAANVLPTAWRRCPGRAVGHAGDAEVKAALVKAVI